MCDFLQLQKSFVLEEWAMGQIENKDALKIITNRFKKEVNENISFSKISNEAFREGKKELAVSLLELGNFSK
jgi:hypothetical protein